MTVQDKVNILLVDDQPAKLLAYEVILRELDENLLVASSGREALECLLKNEVAVILVDVCMPDLNGFELAEMIREHPRFQKTAMIFISAIQVTDIDRLRGYEMGAVDYVPVPVIPEVLRAKVKVFAELHRTTRQLERFNAELEERVRARTAELEASTALLLESERRRTLAIAAGKMGSWDWDARTGDCLWDAGQYNIFGVDPARFQVSVEAVQSLFHPDDKDKLREAIDALLSGATSHEIEFRIRQPNGAVRWCMGTAAATMDENQRVVRLSGVTIDITERKQTEQRQALLAQEVDHRAKNALALVQSLVRLTKAKDTKAYISALEGRITALARVHTILSLSSWQSAEIGQLADEELSPYSGDSVDRIIKSGPSVELEPSTAQTIALVLHELATNATKYGALSLPSGRLSLNWVVQGNTLVMQWTEQGGPAVKLPESRGFGTRSVIASIESQLGGAAVFDWRAEGLHCRLSVPLRRVEKAGSVRELRGLEKSAMG